MYQVPQPSRSILNFINSEYCNQASNFKNCYLCFNGYGGEDSMYCVEFLSLKNCVDIYKSGSNEFCYELSSTGPCFQCFYSAEISQCHNVWFSFDLIDCENCFGCVGLRHKKYFVLIAYQLVEI